MPPHMPNTLLIEGVPYTVQRASRADMGENWGRIDYIACTIYLRDEGRGRYPRGARRAHRRPAVRHSGQQRALAAVGGE